MSTHPHLDPASTPRSEELLEHATFLRRLAARLIGPDEAGDVVQEAFALALGTPPRDRGSLRGWLAVVVANLARNRRRGAARQSARERAVARPERIDAHREGEQALERLELQRVLAELVVALPEEQRTVLYLRYIEGRTPSAIARRLAVPLKTIEWRHTRALARLRAELDARSGGNREAWVALFAPWARMESAAAGAPLVAVAALVVLGGAWVAWRWFASDVATAVERKTEVAATAQQALPIAGAALRESLELAEPLPNAAPGVLTGVVLDREDRRPVAGIALELALGTSARDEFVSLATDAEGRFRFETPVARRLVRLRAFAGPRTIPVDRVLAWRLEAGTTIELELLASHGATLAGTVVDEAGTPVAGATVLGRCTEELYRAPPPERRVTSGPDGSFVVEHLGESVRLTAEAPGRACLEGVRGTIAAGTRGEMIVLRLAPAQVFRGEVVDEKARPIAGADLTAGGFTQSFSGDQTHIPSVRRFDAEDCRGVTDADGQFELPPSPHLASRMRVWKKGYLDHYADVRGDRWNRIVLDSGLELSGIVLDRGRRPIADARVLVGDTAQGDATTDENGAFRIGGLEEAPSAYALATAEGYAIGVCEPIVVEPGVRPIEIVLAPELVLAGRVVDTDGNPLVDALLRLEGDRTFTYEHTDFGARTTWEWAADRNQTRTDGKGRFRFDQLYDGRFEIHVWPAEGAKVALPFHALAGDEELVLVVQESARLGVVFAGRVRDACTGRPIPCFTVGVYRPNGNRPDETPPAQTGESEVSFGWTVQVTESWQGESVRIENDQGEYRLSGYVPGLYRLRFTAPGYASPTLEKREYGLGETREDVLLSPARGVAFLLADTEEPSQATLTFRNARRENVAVSAGGGMTSSSLGIDARAPRVAILPRETLLVTASACGHADVEFELDAAREGAEPVLVRFGKEPRRKIHLHVFESDDPSLTGGAQTLETLREAILGGLVVPPRTTVEIEFHQPSGRSYCSARLTPVDAGEFEQVVTYNAGSMATSRTGRGDASICLEPPESVRRVTLTSPGRRTVTLDLAEPGPWPAEPDFRLAVLERLR